MEHMEAFAKKSRSIGSFLNLNKDLDLLPERVCLLEDENAGIPEPFRIRLHKPRILKPKKPSHLADSCKSLARNLSEVEDDKPEVGGPSRINDIFCRQPPPPIPLPVRKSRCIIFQAILTSFKLAQFLFSFLMGLILFPLIGISVILFVVLPRFLIFLGMQMKYAGKYQLLPCTFSFKTSGSEFYTIVHIIKGRCVLGAVRNRIRRSLEVLGDKTNLMKRLVKKVGYYFLEDRSTHFSYHDHIHLLEDCRRVGAAGVNQERLGELLQDGFESCIDFEYSDLPQWEVMIIPRFIYKADQFEMLRKSADSDANPTFYAVVYRAHSAILDREAVLNLFKDDENETVEEHSTDFSANRMKEYSRWEKFLVFATTMAIGPWLIFRGFIGKLISGRKGPTSRSLMKRNACIETDVSQFDLCTSSPLRISSLICMKDLTGTSVTSALLCWTVGAARSAILGFNSTFPKSFKVLFRGQGIAGPESVGSVELKAKKYGLPLEHLHQAYYAVGTGGLKLGLEADKLCNWILFWICGAFPAELGRLLYHWMHRTDILMDILPLGRNIRKVCGNDCVIDVFGWSSIAGSSADFGVTITTYAGMARANFIKQRYSDSTLVNTNVRAGGEVLANEFLEYYCRLGEICDLKLDPMIEPRYDQLLYAMSGH